MKPHLFLPNEMLEVMPGEVLWAVAHMRWLHVSEGELRGIARDSHAEDHLFAVPVNEIDTLSFRGAGMSIRG